MTTLTETHEDADKHEHGMTDAGYVKIAIILALITGLEVSTYYVDFGPLFMPALLIMMVVKFVMVVSYFMHLKFEKRTLADIASTSTRARARAAAGAGLSRWPARWSR